MRRRFYNAITAVVLILCALLCIGILTTVIQGREGPFWIAVEPTLISLPSLTPTLRGPTENPSWTPSPTITSSPTPTATLTRTPTPIRTPTLTPTPSATLTPSPTSVPTETLPPTITPIPLVGVDGSNLFAIPLNNQYYYLGNKKSLAVGFNLKAGGAIGHLLYHGTELLDDTDYGRYLQASLYDGNDVYPINQKHPYSIWGWNPIQAGSKTGVGAEVLEAYASDTEVLIRALGKEWGKANVDSDVVYETTALLHDRYIELYIRANHFGDDYHATSLQEFPAVFFAPTLTYRAYYDGPAPFTGAAFTMARQLLPCFTPGTALNPTEPWLGLFTQNGFGLTVVAPPQDIPFLAWFQCFPSRGGYTSPISQFDIPPNSSREVKIFLIPGDVTSNRALVYKLVPH